MRAALAALHHPLIWTPWIFHVESCVYHPEILTYLHEVLLVYTFQTPLVELVYLLDHKVVYLHQD